MSGNEVKIVHYGERGQGAVVVEKKKIDIVLSLAAA